MRAIKNWRAELITEGQTQANVKILRGIFKGDSLSPLLFIKTMMPHSKKLQRKLQMYQAGSENKPCMFIYFWFIPIYPYLQFILFPHQFTSLSVQCISDLFFFLSKIKTIILTIYYIFSSLHNLLPIIFVQLVSFLITIQFFDETHISTLKYKLFSMK